MVSYEFYVLRMSDANTEQFGARYNFGDLDPGKEVARVLVSQKSKQSNTTAIEVNAYDESKCGPIRDETNVNATAEQLKQLDLNPIEQAFSKLKTAMRKGAARSVKALWKLIGRLIKTFAPQQCVKYFRHAGYGR
jgi:hypothetical protein